MKFQTCLYWNPFIFIWISTLIILISDSVVAVITEDFSVRPPFNEYSTQGDRTLGPYWSTDGFTTIKENFIRIAPDRMKVAGGLQSKLPLTADEFSLSLKFRISGAGKFIHGGGMALWIGDSIKRTNLFSEDTIFGRSSSFYGFGILFTPYKNKESGSVHKDISMIVSDGSKVSMDMERPGCVSEYRFFEGRDSFSASHYSEVKIVVFLGQVRVMVDRDGSGKFAHCFSLKLQDNKYFKNLDRHWITERKTYLSLTAKNSENHNTHDVFHLVYSESSLEDALEQVENEKKIEKIFVGENVDVQTIQEVVDGLHDLQKDVLSMEDDLRHDLEAIEHRLTSMFYRIFDRDKALVERVKVLEENANKSNTGRLAERIRALERQTTVSMTRKMSEIDSKVENKLVQHGSSHSLSFWIVVALLLVLAVLLGWNMYSVRKLASRDKII